MLSQDQFRPASLGLWKNKAMVKWTKAISLLITLAFILPTLGWTFDQSLLEEQLFVQTKLDGKGSKALADQFRIAPYLGQLTEASYHTGGKTVVLIQDLHCNYEIQENIRGILNHLVDRHPELKLVAIEGASGLIPTLDLGLIPDSQAKRAVTDYYVHQGKLTGADHFTICDNKRVELYGAENLELYNKSLDLIRSFSTEENRGLLLEMMDQLQTLKASIYHPALAAFDRKHLAFQEGKLSAHDYRETLLQTAQQEKINPLAGPLAVIAGRRPLNYHEQQIQETYLEKALFQKLAQSPAEKQMLTLSTYLETAERILTIAAAPNDLSAYQQESQSLSFKAVNAYLKKNLGFDYIDLGDDLDTLNQAMANALSFYDLALQRNQTLSQQTLSRLAARHEQTAVLITGGFHTDKIAELLKSKGQSVVVIRPNLTKMQYSSNYYDLLLHPEQESPFEQAVAQAYRRTVAIGVMDQQVNMNFKQEFFRMLDISKRAAQMTIGQSVTLGSVVLTKVSQSMVQIKSALGSFYMNLKNPRGANTIEVETEKQRAQAQPKNWILRLVKSPLMQVFIAALTASSSVAAEPIQIVIKVSGFGPIHWVLVGLALFVGIYKLLSLLNTARGMVRGLVASGMMWSTFAGTALSDYIQTAMSDSSRGSDGFITNISQLLNRGVAQALNSIGNLMKIKRHLSQPEDEGTFVKISKFLNEHAGQSGTKLIFNGTLTVLEQTPTIRWGTVAARQAALLAQSSEALFGISATELELEFETAQLRKKHEAERLAEMQLGERVPHVWNGDGKHVQYISGADIDDMLKIFTTTFGPAFATVIPVDTYAEDPERRDPKVKDFGPVSSRTIDGMTLQHWVERIESAYGASWREIISNLDNEAWFNSRKGTNGFNRSTIKFISQAYSQSRNPATEFLILPRVIIRHPYLDQNEDQINANILYSYSPHKIFQRLRQINGKIPSLLSEIVDKKVRETIAWNLDEIQKMDAAHPIRPSYDLASQVLVDAILHEIFHTMFFHLTNDQLVQFKNLLEAAPKGRVYFKNWIKALEGIQYVRLADHQGDPKYANPSAFTWDKAETLWLAEMFCDLGPMVLMHLNDKNHVHETELGEKLTPQLEQFFTNVFDTLKWFSGEDRLFIFTYNHLSRSKAYQSRLINASLLIPMQTNPQGALNQRMSILAGLYNEKKEGLIVGTPVNLSDKVPEAEEPASFSAALRSAEQPSASLPEDNAASFMSFAQNISTAPSTEENTERGTDFEEDPTLARAMVTGPRVQQSALISTDAPVQPEVSMGDAFISITEGQASVVSHSTIGQTESQNKQTQPNTPIFNGAVTPYGPYERFGIRPKDNNNNNEIIPAPVQEALIGNPDLLNAILGQPRVADIIGQARDLLTTVPEGQPITIGLDSPALTALLQKTISSLGQSNPAIYGRLASSVKIVNLPTAANITPQTFTSWAAGPSITVLTNPPTSTSDYVTVRVNANGQVGVGHQISAIPIQAISGLEEAVKNSLLDQHHQILSNLQNKQELKDYLLVNWKAVDSQNAQLLQNYDHQFTVTGYRQPTAAEQSQLLIPSLEAALKPAFSADQQEILVQINLAALNQVQAAVAKPDNIIMNFGPRNAMVAPQKELGYNLETAVLTQAFGAKGTALMPAEKQAAIDKYTQAVGLQMSPDPVVRALQDQELADFIQLLKGFSTVAVEMSPAHDLNGLENEARQPELMQDKIAEIRKAIAGTYSQKASEALSDNEVADIIGQLAMMDFRTVLGPVTSMLAALQRGEGRPWEEQPSLFSASNPLAYFKGVGRAPTAPGAVADLAVKIKETKHNVAKGISRFFSSILLAIVASAVIKDAIFAAMKAPRQDDVSWLSRFISFLGHPGLRQSLLLMAGIVVGRADVWDRLSPVIKAQLVDLQKLSNSGNDFTKMEKSELEQSYPSLKYDQASFKQLNNRMQRNTLFGFVFWMVKRFQKVDKNSLVGLYPEMFALLSTGNQMEDILWYYSPAQTFSNRVQGLTADVDLNGKPDSGIEKRLAENLSRGLDEARNALNDLTSQIEQAEPDKPVQGALLSQKRDLLFSIYLNRILEKLGEHNSVANVRLLIRLLLKEMSRPDVSVTYKEGILELLKVINPFDQAAYQINLGNNITEPVMLPLALTETALRDYLLLFFEVFDQQGQPMMPLRRIELRHGASA